MFEEERLLRLAFNIANMAHTGQKRNSGVCEDYIWHPVRVANKVAHLGVNARIAGVLHDSVEDSNGAVTVDKIRNLFGDEVADAVDSVTRRDDETYMDMIRRACANPLGRVIKLADNLDNSSDLHAIEDLSRRDFLAKRYARARETLESSMRDDGLTPLT